MRSLFWPLVALGALLLFNLLFTEGFARLTLRDGHVYGSLVDILKLSSRVMLVSLGMTLVIATAGVDLSVGAVVAVAGSLAAKLLVQEQAGLPLALAATSGLCLVLGAWNGALVAWLGVQPIVATLILMVAGRGIAQIARGVARHREIVLIPSSPRRSLARRRPGAGAEVRSNRSSFPRRRESSVVRPKTLGPRVRGTTR